ncbi:MAG: c-type cytochrome [Chloroflexi bacterium]|nr:c-type cytochrome [Chloroflexota bacterium]
MPKQLVVKLVKLFVLGLTMVLTTVGIFATAYAQQGGDISRGKQLYAQNCAVCHGDNAEGRIGARLAKDFPGIRVEATIKQTISDGVPGSVMPAWATAKGGPLTDAQVDDLVAFIRSLGHVAPPVPTGPATAITLAPAASPVATFPPGNATRGATVFAQNCVVCHGERGEGRIGATLAKDWPGIKPEALIDATTARGVPGSKMPGWAKTYGGPLTDQEIADAAAYIRTLKQPGAAASPAPATPDGGVLASPLALVFGAIVVLGLVVLLGVGLAGSRSRK